MIKKIEHVGLVVTDFERSVAFYRDVLGLVVTETVDVPGLKIAFVQVGESQIEILCHAEKQEGYGREGSWAHFALTVADIDAAVEVLRSNNVTCMFDAPREALGGCRIFFFKGPDNETLEFFQPRA